MAQEFFNQGVAQMHSFWAREAERSFLQAAALDPDAPMPHWGIAMVAAGDFRPRFQLDLHMRITGPSGPNARAVEAARKAQKLSEGHGKATDLEKLYIASIAARRDAAAKDPEEAYTQRLRAVLASYPNEVEAKLYLALHLMRGFALPEKKPKAPGTMEAVALLREALKEFPEHPGVHHFIIHGWEGSTFASEAWPSCQRYAELVPNIPHALHMPGHIYSQTGKWEEAAQSFTAAAGNELGYMKADQLYGSGHHGHNVHYLATAYSFMGQYDKALAAARPLLEFTENPREAANIETVQTAYRQGWFAVLRTLVQGQRWDEILEGSILPVFEKPRQQAWRHWATGLAHAAKGNTHEARQAVQAMDAAIKEYESKSKRGVPEELEVARQELTGHIAIASGKVESGLKTLAEAAKRERSLVYTEPPFYPRPALEALGEIALRHGKTDQAEAAFREALQQYPASYRARIGLQQAMERSGKPAQAAF